MTRRIAHKTNVGTMSASDLEEMIAKVVRRVMREERKRDYYVRADGIKVLYAEEDIDPDYLKEINAEANAIKRGKKRMISAAEIKSRLRKSGVNV
jgi:tRNA A37 threonylcarbamoyladenosine dehydratase